MLYKCVVEVIWINYDLYIFYSYQVIHSWLMHKGMLTICVVNSFVTMILFVLEDDICKLPEQFHLFNI